MTSRLPHDAPRGTPGHISDGLDGTVCRIDSFQLASRKESNRPAVGRPERHQHITGSRQWPRRERIESTQPDLGSSVLACRDECQLRPIRRQHRAAGAICSSDTAGRAERALFWRLESENARPPEAVSFVARCTRARRPGLRRGAPKPRAPRSEDAAWRTRASPQRNGLSLRGRAARQRYRECGGSDPFPDTAATRVRMVDGVPAGSAFQSGSRLQNIRQRVRHVVASRMPASP